jgi:hypothetical protein
VVADGQAHLRKITVARDFGASVEVAAGLEPGENVVLNPMVDLADGQKVKIAQPPPDKK